MFGARFRIEISLDEGEDFNRAISEAARLEDVCVLQVTL